MLEPGQVVEFLEENQFVVAVCLDVKKQKPRFLTQANREVVLPLRRLLNVSGPWLPLNKPRHELIDKLKELAATREAIKKTIDLIEIWSLLIDEDEQDGFDPVFMAGLIFGQPIEPDQTSALIRAVIEDKTYFRYRDSSLSVTPADQVENLLAQRRRDEELAREKEEIGRWLAAAASNQDAPEPPQAEEVIRWLIDAALNGLDSPQASRVKGWLEAAGIPGGLKSTFDLLVNLGRFTPDEDLELRRLNLPVAFPQPVLEEAKALARKGPVGRDWSDRVDLIAQDVFTLDGPSTTDFDDALFFEAHDGRLTIYVHITDITASIPPDSALDEEAKARAASIYLTDRRLPMLPEILSEDLLSLRQDELRPALSLKIDVDDQGGILEHELFKSLIQVNRRLIYQEVDKNLNDDPEMKKLHHLTVRLKERRRQNGALVLEVPEVMVRVEPEGLTLERIEQITPARMLVAELMVLANSLAAQHLVRAGVPTLFRSQPQSTQSFDPPPEADPLWVTLRQRMGFSRLEISPHPAPHAGLGVEAYTTFTSPIRRYLDLITLRQLKSLLDSRPPIYDHANLEEINTTLSPLLRAHNQLKFRRQRYWLLKYLAQEKNRSHEALVLDRLKDRFSLVLLETMLRVVSPKLPPTALRPGQRVLVMINRIDPREDYIQVALA